MHRWIVSAAGTALVLGACSTGSSQATGTRSPTHAAITTTGGSSSPGVPAGATLACGDAIDGGPPPGDFEVVLGVVALPTSTTSAALSASTSSDSRTPALFAKTGLLIRAGQAFELDVSSQPGNRAAIGWWNRSFQPGPRFAVPPCPDTFGTGWLAYPGGYWVDRPLCLPLTVVAAGRTEQVRIGIGTACPGQQPPA